ncbi:hypothetical protein MPSEU_000451400 [Mayamaea pseudoterrestris]|nr:hypothetical protein MPSEU_000451400 [Mayamaea pseudoterrestris]
MMSASQQRRAENDDGYESPSARRRPDDDKYYDDDDDNDRDGGGYYDDDGHYVDEDGYYYEDENEALQQGDPELERRRRLNRLNPDYDQEYDNDYDDDDENKAGSRDMWGRRRAKCCDHCCRCCRNCIRGFFVPPICDFRRWCGCPHGACYTVMGFALGLGGLIMMVMLTLNCDVQRITVTNADGGISENQPQVGYGFIAREPIAGEVPQVMGCVLYPDDEKPTLFDAWFQTGRFMLFLSALLGIIGFVVLSSAFCVAWSANTFQHWLMWNYIFAACCTGLGFMIFGSAYCQDNECKLGKGGVSVISIFFFWLTAANTMKSMPEAPPDEGEDDEDLYYENRDDMYRDDVPGQPGPLVSPYNDGDFDDGYQYDEDGNPYFYEEDGTPVFVDSEGNALYYLDEDGEKVYYDDDEEEDDDDDDDEANQDPEAPADSDAQDQQPMDEPVDLLDVTDEEREHGYTVPAHQVDHNVDAESVEEGNHSMPQERLPRVGDDDGPTIS